MSNSHNLLRSPEVLTISPLSVLAIPFETLVSIEHIPLPPFVGTAFRQVHFETLPFEQRTVY